jgi:sugar O-acyltransferase (sialic acid O-acetyltransferase NeuD family)
MLTELLIIGAGGHSRVVIEAAIGSNPSCHIKVADQDKVKQGAILLEKFEIQLLDDWSMLPDNFHVAIGNHKDRKQLATAGLNHDKEFLSVIHNSACVSDSCKISSGTFIAANVIVAAESNVEIGCIINHAAIVDHDCVIGAYSHIAPNVTLGGGVQIGEECLIGAGAVVLPQVKIGKGVTVGAGAVVINDIEANQIVVGVPARCNNLNE